MILSIWIGKGRSTLIYLDTHVLVWIYSGFVEKISVHAKRLINEHPIFISPMVALELNYLFEINRITVESDAIISELALKTNLKICDRPFQDVVLKACGMAWTRDPFDRMIVGQAALSESILITKDEYILRHYPLARWE